MAKAETFNIVDMIDNEDTDNKDVLSEPDFTEDITPAIIDIPKDEQDIDVDYSTLEVQPIELESINDKHGRISDILEALENSTGMSVIPFEMGHIAPEVSSLARHKIFDFDGTRFAMSHKKRSSVIGDYRRRIINTISSGVPFREEINTHVSHNGKDYMTFKLSEDEWTYIIAIFRNYKERLYKTSDGKIILEVLAERR